MEWNKEKTLILIQEFHKRPGLWNMTHEDYRKKETKRGLLEQIAAKFNNSLTAADIERKFHTLRTQYHREINRMYTSADQEYKSKWFAFPHLQFLNDPSACRNSKDNRRGSAIPAKILYLTNLKVDTPSPVAASNTSSDTINQNVLTVNSKQESNGDDITRNLQKNLRELFEETVDSEEDKTADEPTTNTSVEYVQSQVPMPAKSNTTRSSYEAEHIVDVPARGNNESVEVTEVQQEHFQHHAPDQPPPLKFMKTDHGFRVKGSQEVYPEIVYESAQQSTTNLTKKIYKDAETIVSPSLTNFRDEFSIYGECVANELRFLTDRQILISVKHKINTALFEANLANLQKNSSS